MLLPLSPSDDRLLNAFIAAGYDLRALAAAVKKPLATLVAWATSATITPYLEAIERLSAFRERHRQRESLEALSAALKASTTPVETRRIATVILTTSNRLLRALHSPPRPLPPIACEDPPAIPSDHLFPHQPLHHSGPAPLSPLSPALDDSIHPSAALSPAKRARSPGILAMAAGAPP